MEPNQVVQILGAVLLLGAYLALQSQLLSARSLLFSLLNLAGAGLLAWEAWRTYQYGFLILEGTWTLISLVAVAHIVIDQLRREPVGVTSRPDPPTGVPEAAPEEAVAPPPLEGASREVSQ